MPKRTPKLQPVPAARRSALSPEIRAERANVMAVLHPVVQLLGGIAGHNIEIVLHDLTQPESSAVAVANGHVTGRAVGASILSGPKDDQALAAAQREPSVQGQASHSLVESYPTENAAGQLLKTSTLIIRDADGEPFAALCVNADLSMFQAAHAWLERQLGSKPVVDAVLTDAPAQMDTLMKEIINDAVRTFFKPVSMMNKEEKIHALQVMVRRGLFIVKGGVERAAAALGVSRFTIYNYLEELRRRESMSDAPGAATETPAASGHARRRRA